MRGQFVHVFLNIWLRPLRKLTHLSLLLLFGQMMWLLEGNGDIFKAGWKCAPVFNVFSRPWTCSRNLWSGYVWMETTDSMNLGLAAPGEHECRRCNSGRETKQNFKWKKNWFEGFGAPFLTWHHIILHWAGPVQDDEWVAALHGNHSEVVGLVLGGLICLQVVLRHQVFQDIHLKILQSFCQGARRAWILLDVVNVRSWWQRMKIEEPN